MRQRSIADRLFDGIPPGMPETACMLRFVEIVETTEVPTAAIEGFERVRLRLNPEFVERHAATPGRLFMLLMHEIHHVALAHTRRRLADPRDNFALDCVINSLLARRFPRPEFTGLLTSFYPWKFPHCLLRPPPVWPGRSRDASGVFNRNRNIDFGSWTATADGAREIREAMKDALGSQCDRVAARATSIYLNLYLGPGATADEIATLLPGMPLDGILLLGDHESEAPGERGLPAATGAESLAARGVRSSRASAERGRVRLRQRCVDDSLEPLRTDDPHGGRLTRPLQEPQREAAAGPPQGMARRETVPHVVATILEECREQPLVGRGDGRMLATELRHLPQGQNNRVRLRCLIERVADRETGAARVRTLPEEQQVLAPLPQPDRRSVALGILGVNPFLRSVPFPVRSPVRAGERVHLYLDVSGRMRWVEPFYRAVLDCRAWVHPRVHLFSSEVRDVSFADMRAGLVRTDSGHDISCVARHMRRHDIRRACILTCPHVSRPRGADRVTLARAVLGVALPEGSRWGHMGLKDVADHHTFLRTESSE